MKHQLLNIVCFFKGAGTVQCPYEHIIMQLLSVKKVFRWDMFAFLYLVKLFESEIINERGVLNIFEKKICCQATAQQFRQIGALYSTIKAKCSKFNSEACVFSYAFFE